MALLQTFGTSSGAYTNSFSITPTTAVTAGSLLLLNITAGNADMLSTVTDNKSNTWTLAVNTNNAASGARQTYLYYVQNAVAGSTTITITYTSGQFPDSSVIFREYSSVLTSGALDKTSSNNDGASFNTTHDAGTTAATTQASELVILGGGSAGNASPGFTAGTGYANGFEQKGFDLYTYGFMSDKTVSSTGAQSGNFLSTANVQGQGYIATFKLVTAGGTPTNLFFFGS